VTGVATKGQGVQGPIVVSNAGIQPTVLKFGRRSVLRQELRGLRQGHRPEPGFTNMRYIFSKPVMEHGVYVATTEDTFLDIERLEKMRDGIIPERSLWTAWFRSHFDSEMAPPGKQMLKISEHGAHRTQRKELKALTRGYTSFSRDVSEAVPYIGRIEGHAVRGGIKLSRTRSFLVWEVSCRLA